MANGLSGQMWTIENEDGFATLYASRPVWQIGRNRNPRGRRSNQKVCQLHALQIGPHPNDAVFLTGCTSVLGSIVGTIKWRHSVSSLSTDPTSFINVVVSVKMSEIEKGLDQCNADLDCSISAFNVSDSSSNSFYGYIIYLTRPGQYYQWRFTANDP